MGEPENFAEIFENHELRRWGGVPLGPFCFSIDPDRESRLLVAVEFDGLGVGCAGFCALPLVSGVPSGLLGSSAGVGIVLGCDVAGVFGGEADILLVLSVFESVPWLAFGVPLHKTVMTVRFWRSRNRQT